MSRKVTLKQACVVETFQGNQMLSFGCAEAGETITLLAGNQFRTQVTPQAYRDDLRRIGRTYYPDSVIPTTPEEFTAAQKRVDAYEHGYEYADNPMPYGDLY